MMESGLVTLSSAGSHTYQAHRIVLAAAIPYFRQGCGSVPIHLIRIRIRHVRLNTDPDPGFWWPKIAKKFSWKITIYWPMILMCPCIIDFIGGNGLQGW
jgi:hypothetical protein